MGRCCPVKARVQCKTQPSVRIRVVVSGESIHNTSGRQHNTHAHTSSQHSTLCNADRHTGHEAFSLRARWPCRHGKWNSCPQEVARTTRQLPACMKYPHIAHSPDSASVVPVHFSHSAQCESKRSMKLRFHTLIDRSESFTRC